jgi:hypothetical protein
MHEARRTGRSATSAHIGEDFSGDAQMSAVAGDLSRLPEISPRKVEA